MIVIVSSLFYVDSIEVGLSAQAIHSHFQHVVLILIIVYLQRWFININIHIEIR